MAGIIAVYSLVIAVLIAGDMGPPPQQHYSLYTYARSLPILTSIQVALICCFLVDFCILLLGYQLD